MEAQYRRMDNKIKDLLLLEGTLICKPYDNYLSGVVNLEYANYLKAHWRTDKISSSWYARYLY